MPKNDLWGQGVQYPALSDVPDIETALGGIVNGIVGRTVMRFANANARAAALTGSSAPVPGMITYLLAEDRYDVRMANNTWQTLTPGPWQVLPFASGIGADGGSPGYRSVNGDVQLRGRVNRTNGGRFTYSNAADWLLATLPTAVRPSSTEYWTQAVEIGAGTYYCRLELRSDGSLIARIPPEADGTTGGLHWISIAWRYSLV
ncbi:hypothetical protein [Streptomyces asiaticus]|uniref:hypothetical protein n=1 Tax=Streptomyces asiaticus TaxID=114695 RepID=UPI001BAAFFAC|nr:hypothetical protein [Streptomyces asiaticus]